MPVANMILIFRMPSLQLRTIRKRFSIQSERNWEQLVATVNTFALDSEYRHHGFSWTSVWLKDKENEETIVCGWWFVATNCNNRSIGHHATKAIAWRYVLLTWNDTGFCPSPSAKIMTRKPVLVTGPGTPGWWTMNLNAGSRTSCNFVKSPLNQSSFNFSQI